LRDCGVGIVDLAFGIGTPEQKMIVMDLIAREVLPTVQSWPLEFNNG
jgi:hypothetical protein